MQVSRISFDQTFQGYSQDLPPVAPRRVTAPVYSRPVNRGALLGQAAKVPLSITYDDASRMLQSAEAIIGQTPACNLPVIDRFRSFVKSGSRTSNLELSTADAAELDQFSICAETKGAQGARGSVPAAPAADTLGLVVAGAAAAAMIGFMFWYTS